MCSGILITDISDHFPIFNISQSIDNLCVNTNDSHAYRKITTEKLKKFSEALNSTNWSIVLNEQNREKAFNLFLYTYCKFYNIYIHLLNAHS